MNAALGTGDVAVVGAGKEQTLMGIGAAVLILQRGDGEGDVVAEYAAPGAVVVAGPVVQRVADVAEGPLHLQQRRPCRL